MIIYFADRGLNILGHASTSLPGGVRIVDDTTVEDIDSGVNSFTCKVSYNENTRSDLEEAIQVGRFVLKSAGRAFDDEENIYDSLYQIIETEYDTETQEIYIYAEDAGLDLINKVSPEATLTNRTLEQMLDAFVPADWEFNINGCPTGRKSNTWDGENTTTERINSIANLFGCEVYYSFVIERFEVLAKVLNVTPKRGTQEATAQLRLNQEINRITIKESIANLATAFTVTGGTPESSETPITLVGYNYEYVDPNNGDVYRVDRSTGQMRNITQMARWSSALDTDGLVVKSFTFDTTDRATLAGQARAELQKVSYPEVNYECDFVSLPDDVEVGDRINIIDEDGELYLEARLLRIETSVTGQTQTATIGEYLIKEAGIADIVRSYAAEFAVKAKNGADGVVLAIASSGGNIFHNQPISTTLSVSVFSGVNTITNQTDLEAIFGSTAVIKWYDAVGTYVASGFTLAVSSPNDIAKFTARLET